MAPSDENELCNCIATSTQINDKPSAFRYPRGEGVGIKINEKPVPWEIGKGRIIGKETSMHFIPWNTVRRLINRVRKIGLLWIINHGSRC